MKTRTLPYRVLAVCLLTVAAGCNPPKPRAGPVDTGSGTLAAARSYLEGRWSLESFEVYPLGKPPIAVKGSGSLVYDAFGNLRVEIRADQETSGLLRAAGIDLKDGVISSDGRTVVDMQNHTITYVVPDQSGTAGPLALSRPRHWKVDGDLLTLTTQDDKGQPLSVGKWKKS
jgi:hypothetical protein